MKKLLIILLLTLGVSTMGQDKSIEIEGIKTDTIPVVMLCSDTAGYTETYIDHSRPKTKGCTPTIEVYHPRLSGHPIWIRGYEVKKKSYYWGIIDEVGSEGFIPVYNHACYLDHEKKPIKMMVWITKEISHEKPSLH